MRQAGEVNPTPSSSAAGGRHPWARIAAWLIDWVVIIAWAGVVAAVAIPLYVTGGLGALPIWAANLLSAAVLVVPVTLALAWGESRGATLGKRVMRLHVADEDHARIGYPRAVARNALKIAAPWLVGHAAVYAIVATSAAGEPPAWVWLLTGVAYLLPIVWIVTLVVGSGRPPYDRVTRTQVSPAPGR
jgi:hypothetical protein